MPAPKDIGKSLAWIPHTIRTRLVSSLPMPIRIDTNPQKKTKTSHWEGMFDRLALGSPTRKKIPLGTDDGASPSPILIMGEQERFPCYCIL